MQVITLDPEALEKAAARLAEEVTTGCSGRPYDAIIGIRRGGSFVRDAFCRTFPTALCGERHDVTLQRPGTRRKGGLTARILKCLPLKMLDLMRMAESRLLSFRDAHKREAEKPHVSMDSELTAIVTDRKNPRILLIDDAIDSGRTLSAVIATLKNMNPSAEVETAVITETTDSPAVKADYTIYRNRTLIRFPWSNDYKKTHKAQHS